MTTIINDLQKQEPGSAFVELFELQISPTEYAYFHPGNDDSFGSVQFRDRITPATIRTYVSLPVEFTGFEASTEGTSNRPRITFANVLATFASTIGITNDELIGKTLIRRRTLQKYLYGEANDTNPPVEYGIQTFVIDRKETETNLGITFELASPFDLDTITIPRRQIIPNACNWIYQGASPTLNEHQKRGGCYWRADSNIYEADGTARAALFDSNDNPCISNTDAVAGAASFASPVTLDNTYYTDSSLTRRNLDGTTTASSTKRLYWQAKTTGAVSAPTLANTTQFRRVRNYTTWVSGTTYYSYVEGLIYSDIVLHDNKLWAAKVTTDTTTEPNYGSTWERVDLCGKRLNSCAVRFGWQQDTLNLPKLTPLNKELPYGGFPASRTLES